jgi:hypothetical protein
MVDKEQAKVYELLTNVFCKALIVVVMLAAILPLTLVIILKHYFKS